jgi:sn-glycerol 3-phosphate transport system permease protein
MRRSDNWLAHVVLIAGAALFLVPIWLAFCAATLDPAAIDRGELSLIPRLGHLNSFWDVLVHGGPGVPPVWRMLLVSFGMALAIAIGKIAISIISAFAVVFFRFPLRQMAFWAIFVTLMLPVEVRIIPTYAVMADLHMINTFPGLAVPLMASATATLLFRQTFAAIPDEAANLAALFVILFVLGWNQYLWPLVVATNPNLDTIVIGIVKMIGIDTSTEWNKVMATAVIALIPPVVVVLSMQRWFVRGLTEGEK